MPSRTMTLPAATLYGSRVGLGDLDGDGPSELVAASGPDPDADSTVFAYSHSGSSLLPLSELSAFPSHAYGLNPAVIHKD